MDVNDIIYEFKTLNGVGKMLKTSFTDMQFADVIINISRKTFSRYFKHTIKEMGLMFDPNCKINGIFKIPDNFIDNLAYEDMAIIGIKDLRYTTVFPKGSPSVAFVQQGSLGLITNYRGTNNNLLATSVGRRRLDMYRSPLKYVFRAPDKIEFKSYIEPNQKFDIEFNTTHAKNLSTIDEGYAEAFKELCFLDLKIVLYNSELKYLDGTNMGDLQLELKIESFISAESDKKELLNDWKEKYLMDSPRIISANY